MCFTAEIIAEFQAKREIKEGKFEENCLKKSEKPELENRIFKKIIYILKFYFELKKNVFEDFLSVQDLKYVDEWEYGSYSNRENEFKSEKTTVIHLIAKLKSSFYRHSFRDF